MILSTSPGLIYFDSNNHRYFGPLLPSLIPLLIVLSIGFSFYKKYFKDKPIFKNQITNYIASLLLMISLMAVSIIPDNQFILEKEYTNIKNKLTN